MEVSINLVEKIFSGNFFNLNYRLFTGKISSLSAFADSRKKIFQITGLLNEPFYCSHNEISEVDNLARFFSAILLNQKKPLQIFPVSSISGVSKGYLIENKENSYFLPDAFYKKLLVLLSKKNVMQIPDEKMDFFLLMLEDEFLIQYRNFPYKVDEFLLALDVKELQMIFNHLLSKKLCDARMLYPLITEDKSGKLLSCLSKNLQNEITGLTINSENYNHWREIAAYQLKANLGDIVTDINHSGIKDYIHINQMIINEQIIDFLEKISIEKFTIRLKEFNNETKIFSLTANNALTLLIRGKYSDYFIKNCSKRRIEMIREEKEFSLPLHYADYSREMAKFITGAILLEYEYSKREKDLFADYIRGIYGTRDFDMIFSRMDPLNFAICFLPSSEKVQQYIVEKVSSLGSAYLKDFFSGKIGTLVPVNQGWIDACREEFTKQAFCLHYIGKLSFRDK